MATHNRVIMLTDDNTIKGTSYGSDGQAYIADGAEILGVDPGSVVNTEVTKVVQRVVRENGVGAPELKQFNIAIKQTQGPVSVITAESGTLLGAVGDQAEANSAAISYAYVKITTV